MKMILQKHTSKFVAGLFNSLGITACVALTSCGDENKGKQTENQGEELKNKLKTVDFYKSLAEDEGSLKTIADWLNSKNYGSDYILTAKDLQEIFQNDSSKLNDVAGKLGVELNESDNEFDDEEEKEINKWLTKLNSLENADFNRLDEGLKEKVAQKFIDDKIDITNDDVITSKLADFINEVKEKKKQNEISIKIEGKGKVIITKVVDNTTTDFVFEKIEVFEKFVEDLDGKEITNVEGELSFAFADKNVKICGHENGFDVTGCFEKFLNCFEVLTKIEVLKLKVSDLSLKVENSKLTLNGVDCSGEYFKTVKFLTLVKDHAAFFGIAEEKNKFEIEKEGDDANAVVKIGGVKTELVWSEVVDGENTLKKDSGWDKIFKMKNESGEDVKTKEVTVKFISKDKYSINKSAEVNLKDLNDLKKFVDDVKGKTVTVEGDEKVEFSVKNDNAISVTVGGLVNFDVEITKGNFSALLGCVGNLQKVGLVKTDFKFKVEAGNNAIKFGGVNVASGFLITKNAWGIIKTNKGLFDLGAAGIKVDKSGKADRHVKIGNFAFDFDVLDSNGTGKKCQIKDEWSGIFTLGN